MKKILFISALFSLFIFFSCKKNNSTSGSGSSNNTGSTNSQGYYGILSVHGKQTVMSGTLTPLNNPSAQAYFSSVPTYTTYAQYFTAVNKVSLNGIVYKYYPGIYADTTYTPAISPYNWVVNGLGSIPSFTYTNTNNLPSYTGYNFLPDTIYKAQQNTIQLSGINGADTVTIYIFDHTTHQISLDLVSTATSVSFSSSALSILDVGANATIVTYFTKNNVQTFSGKKFSFPIYYQINKNIYIK